MPTIFDANVVMIASFVFEGVKLQAPPVLEPADTISDGEATSDYYSLQQTPNHSRHCSSVLDELSSPPPLSPSVSFFSYPLISIYRLTPLSWLRPSQVVLSVGEGVWSRMSTRWKR